MRCAVQVGQLVSSWYVIFRPRLLSESEVQQFDGVIQVLFAISVTANTAPTIYSCGLSSFVVFPFLAKGKRSANDLSFPRG